MLLRLLFCCLLSLLAVSGPLHAAPPAANAPLPHNGATERILAEPRPFVLQTALNDFYVSDELNAYTDAPSAMASVYSALHANIQDHSNEAGVEIMSPHYSTLRDGNMTTIPADYLPADYQPPAHRIAQVKP
jgi:small-conductance mechanosensitive channel